MSHSTQKLVHNAATTLGFAMLLPGIVMLMWFYSAATGVTRNLYIIAVVLSIAGAAFLLIAITMRLARPLQRTSTPREAALPEGSTGEQPAAIREDGHWVAELHPIPSYRTVVADGPGAIWTIPRMPLSVGAFSVPQLTPPPLYESVFDGAFGKDTLTLPATKGSRRIESESGITARSRGPDLGPRFSIEPLTPPPVYEPGQMGPVFTFEPQGDPE